MERFRHGEFSSLKEVEKSVPFSMDGGEILKPVLFEKLVKDLHLKEASKELSNLKVFRLFVCDETQIIKLFVQVKGKIFAQFRKELMKDVQDCEKALVQAEALKKEYDNYMHLGKKSDSLEQSITYYEKARAVFQGDNILSKAADTELKAAKKILEPDQAELTSQEEKQQQEQAALAKAKEEAEKQKASKNPRPGKAWAEPVKGMEFVWVKGGCFQIGQTQKAGQNLINKVGQKKYDQWYKVELPRHKVCVNGFWMGRYEVTQAEYQKVAGRNPSNFIGDRRPVENVSWNDAKAFISKLNNYSVKEFFLPTEAQWEYAARSRGKNQEYAGSSSAAMVAWYGASSGGKTHQVGTKDPNGLGLYDMSGNVYEWCQDAWDENAYSKHSQNNPVITSGPGRVLRGGGWGNFPWGVRTGFRFRNKADYRLSIIGFRLCFAGDKK